MKFYRFEDQANTWWAEYRTSGMENSLFEKVVSIYTSNGVDPDATMLGLGLPSHLGDEVTEIGLKALSSDKGLVLKKRYESNSELNFGAGFATFNMLDAPNDDLSADYTGIIDNDNKTVLIQVPYGTTVTALIATFTFNGATVKVGAISQVSGTTANDYTTPVEFIVTSAQGNTETYTVTVEVLANTAAEITAFSFAEQTGAATIDNEAATIDIEVANGTSPLALVATFTLSAGASATVNDVAQVSATTENDFTDPVEYVVTAEDEVTTKTWTVTVTVAEA